MTSLFTSLGDSLKAPTEVLLQSKLENVPDLGLQLNQEPGLDVQQTLIKCAKERRKNKKRRKERKKEERREGGRVGGQKRDRKEDCKKKKAESEDFQTGFGEQV